MSSSLCLVTATAMEMRAVLEGMGIATPPPSVGESCLVRGKAGLLRLLVCGVGPLAAAFSIGKLVGQGLLGPEHCRGILSLGIAGSYDAKQAPVGSVVLAEKEIWPEYGLAGEGGVDPVALGFPLAGKKDDTTPPPVWNSISCEPDAALEKLGCADPALGFWDGHSPLFARGSAITVAGVSASTVRAKSLHQTHGGLMENMEGFPLALAALQCGLPFLEMRSISNLAGPREGGGWDISHALASLSQAVSGLFAL